ncbi:MAG: 2-amino-4-hydroxy-6-hydroxymethyldihydropteridine diphosphokinase [candidate division Zixibacteria bacterium]|nr:2-amino-4-hydroxy-6-hydroxymethyldihydropteridine diphosphokinase [candidate division Zixibacteria bacterium]
MTLAAIGIGGNIGDRLRNLTQAVTLLATYETLRIVRRSSWYETVPLGYTAQPRFLNGALAVETLLSPHDLLATLLTVERRSGRVRTLPNGPRTVDLDLLFYGDRIVTTPDLTLPHPGCAERAFVLVPLAEILPEFVHPVLQCSVASLLESLGPVDDLVKPYTPSWESCS